QMGLEDIAMFGVIPDSIIFHPCDAVSAAKLLPVMISHKGISYLRTLRPKTPVIYDSNEEFTIGGSKVLRSSKKDILTVIAAGITVHEALKAYETLKKEKIYIRVVDCYSVKPIDAKTLQQCSNETMKQLLITVEDHYSHGGLGDFVQSAVSAGTSVEKMAVSKTPRSGTKEELLDFEGINASHIVEKVKSLLQ
ncbi:MAG: transketolase C-terminal domain-containing protein, partial [bacterium]|nr:transketolase C-terminal domain-containing protein [bacterium]